MEDTFRQKAQQSTRIIIAGVEVNPSEVGVDLTPYGGTSSEIEIRISKEALAHELSEAGQSVDADSLEGFVRMDIENFPSEAITGYLGIAQSILSYPKVSKFFGLLPKRKADNCKRWSIFRVDVVEMDNESLILRGSAREINLS